MCWYAITSGIRIKVQSLATVQSRIITRVYSKERAHLSFIYFRRRHYDQQLGKLRSNRVRI